MSWHKVNALLRHRTEQLASIPWLSQPLEIAVTSSNVVVVPSDLSEGKTAKAKVAAFAAGALLFVIPAAIGYRAYAERVLGNIVKDDSLRELFRQGLALVGDKHQLKFHHSFVKKSFLQNYQVIAICGVCHHFTGDHDLCFVFSTRDVEKDIAMGHSVIWETHKLKKLGWEVVNNDRTLETHQIREFMREQYPFS